MIGNTEKEWVNQIVDSSMTQVAFSMLILLFGTILSQMPSPMLSKQVPPVINQISLCGLLPLSALKVPHYPLLYLNVLLFITMSTLNMLFMVKSKVQYVIIFVIIILFIPLVHVYYH